MSGWRGNGGCEPVGWKNTIECAEAKGEKVFQMYGPSECEWVNGEYMHVSLPHSRWCKDRVPSNDGRCWLPYSINSDNECFPYDKDRVGQWTLGNPEVYGSVQKVKGGATIVLPGRKPETEFTNVGVTPPRVKIHGGSIALVAVPGVGAAAVIGMVLFNRKRQLRSKKADKSKMELVTTGNAGTV